jgi:hypothetical protein
MTTAQAFEPSSVRRGQGLANLEDRATAMGGKASVTSDPGEGTMVRVSCPCSTYCTISAVTIPYIPCGPSTCGRMWQWYTHTPGYSASTSTSNRWPGATINVSAM